MLDYPKSSTTTLNQALDLKRARKNVPASIQPGKVGLIAQRQHNSLIVYAIPSERMKPLIPGSFEAEETVINGRLMSWISVESFLDLNTAGGSSFEQTNYRLHVLREKKPCLWLLGTSLGSLSAVGSRNLWPLPWHLSAMEFRVAYNPLEKRYRTYGLQTQSQWANSSWQIEDTGELINPEMIQQLPASLQRWTATNYFLRRDGFEGQHQVHGLDPLFTRAHLESAKCDLLDRLGLLDKNEIRRPQLAALQHSLSCQFGAPSTAAPARDKQDFLLINPPASL